MKILNFRFRSVITALLFVCLSSSAFATLQINFSESVDTNRIQFYWSGDPSGPDQDGRIINTDANTEPDLDNPDQQAKVDGVSDASFHFFADEDYPKSKTTILRLWDQAVKTEDALYTETQSWSNPPLGTEIKSFTKPYAYRYSAAAKAIITKYDETGTVNLFPSQSFAKSATFTSAQPENNGYAVQVKEVQWKINDADRSGSTTLKLASPTDDLSPGTSYSVQVRHKSYVGDWGPWSDVVIYTVGAGQAVLTFPLKAFQSNKLVVNSITVPPGLGVANASGLVNLINSKAKDDIVIVLGRWDPEAGIAHGYNPKTGEGDFDLEVWGGYQLYVTKDYQLTLP